jgi:glucose/arabinose dehydrogenase
MPRRHHPLAMTAVAVLALAACGKSESQTTSAVGYGHNPALPAPNKTLLPTVKVSPVNRWANGATPTAAAGFQVKAFATGLTTRAGCWSCPMATCWWPRPTPRRNRKGFRAQGLGRGPGDEEGRRRGAQRQPHQPAARRRRRRRGRDQDSVPDRAHSPFGMALVGDTLYVANADAMVEVPLQDRRIPASPPRRARSPTCRRPINHHWTKNIIASPDGTKLYATVGSNSNVGENGMEAEEAAPR